MRLLIADDDSAIRAMIRHFLEAYEIVGEAANGAEAVEAAERLQPDIILLDISMPVMSGFVAARRLKETMPYLPIIFLTHYADPAFIDEAFRLGANAYVLKRLAVHDLATAIERVSTGETFRSASR